MMEERHYAFFQNRDCEYFPCHATKHPEDLNCLVGYEISRTVQLPVLLLSALRARTRLRRQFPLYGERDKGLLRLSVPAPEGKL